jgi:hypothetical protein
MNTPAQFTVPGDGRMISSSKPRWVNALIRNERAKIMATFARVAAGKSKSTVRASLIALASAAVLVLPPAAFAQHQSQYGTAVEAKAMLLKAVAAVKSDEAGALDMFNKGKGGFLDRDLHPFCATASDGKFVANAGQLLGLDIRGLQDSKGKQFGLAQFAATQKPEGQLTEVSYLVPNSGVHRTPLPKVSLTTRVGDLVCGVSYYPMTDYFEPMRLRRLEEVVERSRAQTPGL